MTIAAIAFIRARPLNLRTKNCKHFFTRVLKYFITNYHGIRKFNFISNKIIDNKFRKSEL